MQQPVANIKSLLRKGSDSSINCCHRVIAERILSKVKKFDGRHHDLVDSYNVAVSQLISDLVTLSEAL